MEEPEDPEDPDASDERKQSTPFLISLLARIGFVSQSRGYRDEPGSSRYGCSMAVSLADPADHAYFNEAGEPADAAGLTQVLQLAEGGHFNVLDPAILHLPVPGLKPDGDVFLEGPVPVWDAFFFRGV